VNTESGLLGVSELSADMYTLLQNEETNSQAAEAINLFCYQVKKGHRVASGGAWRDRHAGVYGRIGEQSPVIRQRICEGLEFLALLLMKPKTTTSPR